MLVIGALAASLLPQAATAASANADESPFIARYEAEEGYSAIGNVHLSSTIGDQPADLSSPLTGYSGSGFLDFSDPVADYATSTAWRNTIPAGQDGAKWTIHAPKAGNYELHFVYNNPATKWNGSRNVRDERNMRVNINSSSFTSNDGWAGWMIFSVSGYNDSASPGVLQTAATVGQNTAWNNNYMNVKLDAGENTLLLSIQAPPGQGVYDGPNLDYFEVRAIDDEFTPASEMPRKTTSFEHPGIFYTMDDLEKMKEYRHQPDSVWAKGYAALLAANQSSSTYARPGGYFPIVERGPYNNPSIGASQFEGDSTVAHYNALRWFFDGDIANAKKAIEVLNGWSYTLQDVVNNDSKLILGMAAPGYLNAAEILKHVYNNDTSVPEADKWSDADMKQFDSMVRNVWYRIIGDYYPQANGNWDSLIGSANMAIGTYLDDRDIFNRAIEQYLRGDVVPDTLSMGALPNYTYPTGESQESNRDQTHAIMGLRGVRIYQRDRVESGPRSVRLI